MNNESMTVILGTVAMEPKGEYNAETYYEKLNTVLYNDSTYMAKEPVQGETPSESTKWQLIAGGITKEYLEAQTVDNLDSTSTTKPLSAKQGKVLNEGKIQVFDTVADMKAATLKNGMTVQTLGYYSANDGGAATYKITSEEIETEYQEEVGDLYATLIIKDVVNVKQMGAHGDNQHGDRAKIQAALNYTKCSTVYFPNGIYICGNLEMSRAIDLIGENATLTETVSNPILNININGEYRNHVIKGLKFINNGTGNCVEINTTSSFASSKIENCFFQAASGWGLKTNSMFSHSLIELCTFSKNGLYLECGDANTVRKCMFYGVGTGIFLKPTDFGMLNNTIDNNTIVNNGYAIHVERGDQVMITNNQIEYATPRTANTNNPNCSIFINGQYQTCKNVVIDKNNFGGGSYLDYNIAIYSGKHCKITRNRFCSTAQEDIKSFNYYGGSNLNKIKDNIVYNNSGYRPREDKWQPVRVNVNNYPNGVTNVWLPLTMNNSTDILYYMKDDNNVIHFQPTHATFSSSTDVIATLPVGYWPKITTIVNGTKDGSQHLFTVQYDGKIKFESSFVGATDFVIDDFIAEMGASNID